MSSLSKEECIIIGKMFEQSASANDMLIIRKAIAEVKNRNGLYDKSVICKGDLYSFKFVVAEHTGLDLKASGELGRILYHLVKPFSDRERMINTGITYGLWVYEEFLCSHPSHAEFRGMKLSLEKGLKIGLFKRVFPQQLVGCGCSIKPVLDI